MDWVCHKIFILLYMYKIDFVQDQSRFFFWPVIQDCVRQLLLNEDQVYTHAWTVIIWDGAMGSIHFSGFSEVYPAVKSLTNI